MSIIDGKNDLPEFNPPLSLEPFSSQQMVSDLNDQITKLKFQLALAREGLDKIVNIRPIKLWKECTCEDIAQQTLAKIKGKK